jgi:ceramide glucosyltransferase
MPLGSRPRNLWAELECSFLNTFEARWQYCAEAMGLGFAQGKTMLWRREVMEKGGGIRALGAEIAEDAAATKLVHRQGLNINLVDSPFEQPLGCRGFRDVWLRQVRWARMRRKTFPLFYAPEIVAGTALPCLAAAYAAWMLDLNVAAAMLGVALALRSGSASRASEQMALLVAHAFPFRLPRPDTPGHLHRRLDHR